RRADAEALERVGAIEAVAREPAGERVDRRVLPDVGVRGLGLGGVHRLLRGVAGGLALRVDRVLLGEVREAGRDELLRRGGEVLHAVQDGASARGAALRVVVRHARACRAGWGRFATVIA